MQTTLFPPLGSGPYKVDSFEVGALRHLSSRDPNYWGAKLPVNVGPTIGACSASTTTRIPNVALIAFLAGAYDMTVESSAKNWATQYDVPAVKDGRIKQGRDPVRAARRACSASSSICASPCSRTSGCARRWAMPSISNGSNKNLFFGQYTRTKSYFDNSELASNGLPDAGRAEDPGAAARQDSRRGLHQGLHLADHRRQRQQPRQSAQGRSDLLEQAGWIVKDGKRVNKATGEPFRFEILLDNPLFERHRAALHAEPEAPGDRCHAAHGRTAPNMPGAPRPSTTT